MISHIYVITSFIRYKVSIIDIFVTKLCFLSYFDDRVVEIWTVVVLVVIVVLGETVVDLVVTTEDLVETTVEDLVAMTLVGITQIFLTKVSARNV